MVDSVVNNRTDLKNMVSFHIHCLYSVPMIFITELGTDSVSDYIKCIYSVLVINKKQTVETAGSLIDIMLH